MALLRVLSQLYSVVVCVYGGKLIDKQKNPVTFSKLKGFLIHYPCFACTQFTEKAGTSYWEHKYSVVAYWKDEVFGR